MSLGIRSVVAFVALGFAAAPLLLAATRARGDQKIEHDPNYWADQTMVRLLDAVSS